MVPPVPIPNTEVKRLSADDTAPARMWENRSLPEGLLLIWRLTLMIAAPLFIPHEALVLESLRVFGF